MDITLKELTIADIFNGYEDNAENGVTAYGGRLNVRPAFQREFVYNDKERNAVIDTILKGFPLNVMYWCDDGSGNYELLDGQQRTISFCQYIDGKFSVMADGTPKGYANLTETEKRRILDYKLMIYVCSGNDKEKLDWFKTINIAGEQLTAQELRNAVYTGTWLSDAKRYFSKSGCAAYQIGNKLLSGSPIRQEYLETAISWLAAKENMGIEDYMALHQHDSSAAPLWLYYQNVISWVNVLFPNYRKEMKGIKWGLLYNAHSTDNYDPQALEQRISQLMADDDVTNKKGIYEYLLTGKEKCLSIRAFSDTQKREAYERQQGICPICKKHFALEQMHADHITPWHAGGKTTPDNLQMLCRDCNLTKSGQV